jgi:hypothetical protein
MAADLAQSAGKEDFLPPPSTKKQYSIMVRSGDYAEKTPIFLPPNTSLIGDNLRRTTIRPFDSTYENNDMFWVSSACYVWGFTFRGHKSIVETRTVADVVYNPSTDQYEQTTKLVEDIVGGGSAIAFPVPVEIGACFKIAALPAIIVGTAKRNTCQKGKFQGMIAKTTPKG